MKKNFVKRNPDIESVAKTVFVTAFSRQSVKDILLGDTCALLEKESTVRLVALVPAYRKSEFERAFHGRNIVFEGIADVSSCPVFLNSFFERCVRHYENVPVFVRRILRFFDRTFVRAVDLDTLFEKHQPALIFSSCVSDPLDQKVLREAKRHGITTVGMVDAWNTAVPSRFRIRLVPDDLIVWNKAVKDEILRRGDVSESRISISGVPRLDHYLRAPYMKRNEWCRRVGIDPSKKIILFVSVPHVNPDERHILSALNAAIEDGALSRNTVVLVRNYPQEETAKGSLYWGSSTQKKNIVFDNAPTFWGEGKTFADGLSDEIYHAADSLYHADTIVTTQDTMGIDARFFHKPVVNTAAYFGADDLIGAIEASLGDSHNDDAKQKEFSAPDEPAGSRIAHRILTWSQLHASLSPDQPS